MRALIFLLFISMISSVGFAAKVATFPTLQNPNSIIIDNGQVFINDGPVIYIYAMKDFTLQKKFGKKGEGPREFKVHPSRNRGGVIMDVQQDYLLIGSMGRISYFTRNGEYKSERQTFSFWNVKALGDKFVVLRPGEDQKKAYFGLNIYEQDLKTGKEIFRPLEYTLGKKVDPIAFFRFPFLHVYDNKIFISGDDDIIYIFDHTGKKVRSITQAYEKVKVTQNRIQRYKDFLSTDMGYKEFYKRYEPLMQYPDYFPKIRYFHVADKKVYVLTYNEKENKKQVVIYGVDGKLLKKLFLGIQEMNPLFLYPYTIHKGKYYQLVDNLEKEEWELHVGEI